MPIQTGPLDSWQVEQPLVTPLWICAVVGAGVANFVPGAVVVALAATFPNCSTVPRWQVSQVVDDGMCELGPSGEVAGITTIRVMPANELDVMAGPWQAAQLLVMPVWSISEPENFAPFPTGVAAMLEPAPTWQDSHATLVGMWLLGSPTIAKLADGIANDAAAAPWHCAQLAVVLGALAWMLASVGITEKSVEVWQAVHCAVAEVGMWLAGVSSALKKLVLPWHCEQSPLAGCAASATLKVPAAARGRVWKPVNCAPPASVVGAIGYALMPIQTGPLDSWQVEQPLVTPLWICAVVGAGVANFVPGAMVVAALAATFPNCSTVPRWQVSQVVDDGMCELGPSGEIGGITTMLVMPANELPLIDGPWQAAQLLVMPVWLISEPENFAPSGTGVAATLEPAPTWQASQAALVGMWLPGMPTIEKLAAGIANDGAAAPWHCAQLLLVLGAFAWMFASVGIAAKSPVVWHAAHCAVAEVGMWLAGLSCAVKELVLLWHCEQSPAFGWAASATL
jgi:hypothetical protein